MNKELEIWRFVAERLNAGRPVMLLVVAESSGSSPGRQGYKMVVTGAGELCGSIGGGVMEVRLVEQAKADLSKPGEQAAGVRPPKLVEQIHRKEVANSSGMICSGKQTVIFRRLRAQDKRVVDKILDSLETRRPASISITPCEFDVTFNPTSDFDFVIRGETDFTYREKLGPKNNLYIIGGGHCALALSELISKMDFYVSIFDDRPELNTIAKNRFADEITIIDSYAAIGSLISPGPSVYIVVMTLGYRSDEAVIRALFNDDFKYFGVLGSKAKMRTLLRDLEKEGFSKERLASIRTPIGLPINSRTPEEIAVSIVAEIIAVKNS